MPFAVFRSEDTTVNCDQARPKLQDLLEGALTSREAAALRNHLSSCAACRRENALLAMTVEGMALLPVRRPSPAFDARVLAAAAAARRARSLPRAAVWTLNAAATATALWTAALAAFARPKLSLSGGLAVLHILLHPASALSVAELRLAEAGLSVPETLRAVRHAYEVFARIHFAAGPATAALALQGAAAALIAGLIVIAAARPRRTLAVSRRTR